MSIERQKKNEEISVVDLTFDFDISDEILSNVLLLDVEQGANSATCVTRVSYIVWSCVS